MFDIQTELAKLPKSPGVYLMKDADGEVIYVGKAKNLRSRVRSYFLPSNAGVRKLDQLVPRIRSFEYIVTDTEVEALILENNLIKKRLPKYNVKLKDDKTYPYIKVTAADDFPRIVFTREFAKDKSRYFGPYASAAAVHEVLELIRSIWRLRACDRKITEGERAGRPCLNHHIGRCDAPCAGLIGREEYLKMTAEVLDFLEGKSRAVTDRLAKAMYEYSENMEYEKAGEIKAQLDALKRIGEKQKLDTLSARDQDILAVAREKDDALAQVFFVRSGKLVGRERFMLTGSEGLSVPEILSGFITQHYSGTPFIPREIIIETEPEDAALLAEWLTKEKGAKVALIVPQKGEKLKLLRLASKNALLQLSQFGEHLKREKERTEGAMSEIADMLGLESSPARVEIYDVSNIQGYESVASMAVFENGSPKRNDYRKFRIKTVTGANDYASMEEVIRRRFEHYLKEAEESGGEKYLDRARFSKLPDLICIDGGKGQVSSAEAALSDLGFAIPCCGLIKDDGHRTRGVVYLGEEKTLPRTSEGFKLLTRMQDEAHRFAVEYHRKLREKKLSKSALDEVRGVGAARKKALLRRFGSIDKIRYATAEELNEAPGMNKAAAKAVYDYFRRNKE